MGLNNDDLISRAALLKECAECQKTDPNFEGRGWASHFISEAGMPSTEWYCVEDMIENAPAVDAAPVVHARWDEIRDYTQAGLISFECSECGRLCDTLYKYCPRCGARMDGGADER